MTISFNHIPSDIRVPGWYAEVDNSQASSFQAGNKSLLMGQKLAAGSAVADTPVLVTSASQAKSLFGVGSILARMFEAYFQNDQVTETWGLPLADNGAGVAATGTLTITGPATASGTLSIYIAGQRIQVAVTSGDTATTIGDAVDVAVAALTSLPVTSNNVAGVVTFTAKHKGALGNQIDVRVNFLGNLGGEETPAGVTVVIVAMASGATEPSLANAIAAMGDEPYNQIIHPYTDAANLNLIQTEMNDVTGRWSPIRQIYGHGYSAISGSLSALDTLGDSRNDQHHTILGYFDSPTPPWEAVAMVGARAAKAFQLDPARPLQTLKLVGFTPPPKVSRFTFAERQILLKSGISTMKVSAGGEALIERVVTNYRVNTFGQPDDSYLDVTTLYTIQRVLGEYKARFTQKFPRHKLANDGTNFGAGQAIVTPNIIRAELIAGYSEMVRKGWVENIQAFTANLIVERTVNQINVVLPIDVVNQLRVIAVKAQFRLQFTEDATAAA